MKKIILILLIISLLLVSFAFATYVSIMTESFTDSDGVDISGRNGWYCYLGTNEIQSNRAQISGSSHQCYKNITEVTTSGGLNVSFSLHFVSNSAAGTMLEICESPNNAGWQTMCDNGYGIFINSENSNIYFRRFYSGTYLNIGSDTSYPSVESDWRIVISNETGTQTVTFYINDVLKFTGTDDYFNTFTTILIGHYNGISIVDDVNVTWTGSLLPPDTCTYSGSEDWNVDCSDNCIITSAVDMEDNTLNLYGSGTFTILADITVDKLIKENSCVINSETNDGNSLIIKIG